MYAVVRTGGKQYRVSEGEVLRVEKLKGEVGDQVDFNEVLMVSGQDKVKIGTPVLTKASVTGEIVCQGKEKKITVFKQIRRKNFHRKRGHRQEYTEIRIKEIKA
ncbi:MAG: 50S ribosomal protein L21 [Deltaproteobacteria bacterium]|nr:MAG: 50S ribosomal protein L21 [Deltaproteobacteria bacterium]